MEVGAHIFVTGMVQGVGFRYFVHARATRLGLTGFVRNNFDGSVEVEVEGNRSLIEEFIGQLKVGPRMADVRDVRIQWQKFENRYQTFDIQ